MKTSKKILIAVGLFLSASVASGPVFGQGAIPLTLPLFQNSNSSCQDQAAVDETYTVTCGTFTGETPDFADCVATTELRPEASSGPRTEPLLSFFQNQNLHDASSCGGQFAAAAQTDITYPQNDGTPRYLGSVINADFSGSPFNDVVYPVTIDEATLPSVLEEVLSQAGGGFPGSVDVGVLPALEIGLAVAGEDPLNDFSTFRTDFWPRNANFTFGQACDPTFGTVNAAICAADKSAVAVDCNGDGAPDTVTAIAIGNPEIAAPSFINLRTNVNSGGGLAVPPLDAPAFPLPDPDILDDDLVAAAVASGDFGGAGDDVVVAIFTTADPFSQVVVCQNDGACGYTCLAPQSLETLTGEGFSRPFSVAAGDFNGDGADDAAISLAGQNASTGALLSSLLYLFGNGSGGLGSPLVVSTVVDGSGNALLNVGGAPFTDMVPTSLSVGQFDNDGVLDVALTNFHGPVADPSSQPTPFTEPRPQGDVVVFTSNGTSGGGFAPLPTTLNFPTEELFDANGGSLGTFSTGRASGLTSADFDHCGGDDVIALAELCLDDISGAGTGFSSPTIDTTSGNCISTVQRIASIFLNANEAPVVDAGPDLEGEIGQAVAVAAATCSDPTDDDRTFTWTVIASPPGSSPQINPAAGNLVAPQTSAATSFQADVAGDYTLELNCADFCGLEASDSLIVTVDEVQVLTQGGCLATLTPSVIGSWSGFWWALGLAPLVLHRIFSSIFLSKRPRIG